MSDIPTVRLGSLLGYSRLGYGCASLMARTGRRESLRLLEAAFDAGITHFDVARAYGYGEAESVVGEFIARRRDSVTVTTKLGIQPPRRTPLLRAAKAAARRVAVLSPGTRSLMRRRAGAMVAHGRFGLDEARASFERSLRELGTDHVDVLLLHDPRPEDVTDELEAFADECVRSGRARAVGVASGRSETAAIAAASKLLARVVQMPDSALEPDTPPAAAPAAEAIVTHSVLAPVLGAAFERLDDDHTARVWAERLGSDPRAPGVVARLALAAALRRNRWGPVLVSSRDEAHIRSNVATACEPPAGELIDTFEELLASAAQQPVDTQARDLDRTPA